MKFRPRAVLTALFLASLTTLAFAHAGAGGFVLLLPVGYYRMGGMLAVAASFGFVILAPARLFRRVGGFALPLFRPPAVNPVPWSIASCVLLAILVWTGIHGTQDPLQNPLPLVVWTLWWVGFTFVTAVVGNLWPWINPWTGPYRLLRPSGQALAPYPDWLAYWPAVLLFFAFAWFELVDLAPDNPERLAIAVGFYWLSMIAGMFIFGEEAWLGQAEPFSLFFRLISLLAPLQSAGNDNPRVSLVVPGAALLKTQPLPVSGVFFVLLVLSAVSFDGLSKTFFCLGLSGVNPLEFPGRSVMVAQNTLGLLLVWAALALAYICALWLGWTLGGRKADPRALSGRLVLSLVPIALAYHFAHYLTALVINGQFAIATLLPFDIPVTMSPVTTYAGARLIWNLQAAAIIAGHILAVALAHAITLDTSGVAARKAELPIAIAMVLYTLFGLWLLSTPTAG